MRSADDANHNSIPDDLSNYKVARAGDLVINKMKAWQGSLGLAPIDGIVSPAYYVFHADFAVPQFGEYLLRSKPYVAKFGAASDGVRIGQWDLNIPRMRSIEVHLPAADEQAAIVKYLAHAHARIDKAISAKNRLITLLGELDRAVENDLAGSIGIRDDGEKAIPWLGVIPPTWSTIPAKRLFKEIDRRSVTGSEGLLSLRMRDGLVDANEYTETPVPPHSLVGYKIVHPGEMVMNRMRASIGLFGVANEQGLVSPDYSTMTVADGVDPKFFLSLFKTDQAMAEFRRRSNGLGTGASGFMRLYYEDFGAIRLPLPPLEAQIRAVKAIERQRAETTPVRTRTVRELVLLREFRSRLIADVVTGKVDVRAIAATLPEPPDSLSNASAHLDDDLEEVLNEVEE
ncbi:restriction endonuclease subunit S [Microbacterium sp. GCS4]|uniref:restriction endonuclease subunit S n=1 Tax=Microbacterium sp. GCS4 TaxID=1692239 RepID=UPI000681EDCE|nr:restriction endonuclease subunit S [Microbacterium sp. GCS4]